MPDNNDIILEIKDLKVNFRSSGKNINAIRGVDIVLRKGQTIALVGESGSGKSVTMKAVMGILPDNAEISTGPVITTAVMMIKMG